ncbi:MAG: N-acetylmuramoyl-L-alanine amidase [Paludibacteraceae bacterium]|nr:N-acetylmuramoyl-L-alanine amidase [Paludibacteraceae bacterium]
MEIKATQEKQFANAVKAAKPTYFVIAGHRGLGTGAHGYIDEASCACDIQEQMTKYMRGRGAIVVNEPVKMELADVVRMVNGQCKKGDLCLDIHFNASSNPNASGVEAYIRQGSTDAMEKSFASRLVNSISSLLGIANRGVKADNTGAHTRIAMCRDIKCSSVLIEVCFCTSPKDCGAYQQNQVKVAQTMAEIMLNSSKI